MREMNRNAYDENPYISRYQVKKHPIKIWSAFSLYFCNIIIILLKNKIKYSTDLNLLQTTSIFNITGEFSAFFQFKAFQSFFVKPFNRTF